MKKIKTETNKIKSKVDYYYVEEDRKRMPMYVRKKRDEKSLYEWFYFPLYQTVINLEQLAFK